MDTDGQRQHLALLFADVSDSTRIAAGMEPEDYAALLQQVRDLHRQIIAHHGGEIVRIDGDGVLAMFGFPIPHEDIGRRAAEAALDLHAAVRGIETGAASIRLHTGIHAGTVLLRAGDLVRGRFEVLGDATNVAARLRDAAAPDEIIASQAALGADRAFFALGPDRVLRIGHNGRTLMAASITGRSAVPSRLAARRHRGLARFCGRASQVAMLQRLLEQARAGAFRLGVIAGPPGIGKTRLASEFLADAAAGVTVLRGYCEAYLGARPLQPFVQIVWALDGRGPDSAALATPDDLAAMLLAALAGASRQGPVILLIDDWQWADDGSRQVLATIRAQRPPHCLVLLASRHPDADLADDPAAVAIAMPALSGAETATAIASMVAAADPVLVDRIHAESGGNPLFIEELCHASQARHGLVQGEDRHAWLDTLVQARFARLPQADADMLTAAAVIGHMVPRWLFDAVTGRGGDDALIARLSAEDFLYSDPAAGLLRFKHGLTRDAIYRRVGPAQRRALHRQVVDALEQRSASDGEDAFLDALAYHHGAGGNWQQAARYALLAGDRAMAAAALDRAQALYRQALAIHADHAAAGADNRSLARAVHRFGLACVADPAPDQLAVLAAASQRAAACQDQEALTQCHYWLGTINYGLGHAQQAVTHLRLAQQRIESLGSPRLQVQLKANLGQAHLAGGQYAEAEHWLTTALAEMAAGRAEKMEAGWAYALACRGFMLADQGHFDAAAGHYRQAEALLAGVSTPLRGSVVTQQAAVAIWQGDLAGAQAHAATAMAIGQQSRSRYYMMMSMALGAYARWLAGDTNALDELVRAAAWFTSATSQQRSSLCFGWLAEIMAQQDRLADARHYAALSFRRARQGDRLGEAMAARAMARLAARHGGCRPPRHYLALADRAARARQSPRELALNRLCAERLLTPSH